MAQHFIKSEMSENEEGLVEQAEKMNFPGPGSRLGVTAVVGAVMLGMGVMAKMSSGSIKTSLASPGASILAADSSCFEENVAYSLGRGKAGGQVHWILGDGKKGSEHECQIWCQETPGCEFFRFRTLSKRCFLSTNRGGKVKKGNKGAISGPKFCNVLTRPCKEYIGVSSAYKVDHADTPGLGVSTFKSHLDKQQVTVSTWTEAFEQSDNGKKRHDDDIQNYPVWPKGMPPSFVAYMTVGKQDQKQGFNITIDGAPIENMVMLVDMYLPKPEQWNATVSEGIFLPVVDSSGWFRADLLDHGRTIFVEAERAARVFLPLRFSKAVSNVAISVTSSKTVLGAGSYGVVIYKGKNCE